MSSIFFPVKTWKVSFFSLLLSKRSKPTQHIQIQYSIIITIRQKSTTELVNFSPSTYNYTAEWKPSRGPQLTAPTLTAVHYPISLSVFCSGIGVQHQPNQSEGRDEARRAHVSTTHSHTITLAHPPARKCELYVAPEIFESHARAG